MDDNSSDRLTLARRFLEPSNSTHRQYEALRAFFVDGLPSAEAARSVRLHTRELSRPRPSVPQSPRTRLLRPHRSTGRPPGKQKRLREQVVALRKQNLSVHDISRALAREGESLSPAAVAAILKEEGFAKLPRRRDEERPDQPRPVDGRCRRRPPTRPDAARAPHQVRRPVPVPAGPGRGRPGRHPRAERLPGIGDGPGRRAPCGRCWP